MPFNAVDPLWIECDLITTMVPQGGKVVGMMAGTVGHSCPTLSMPGMMVDPSKLEEDLPLRRW
jgi:hypothetical protein